MTDPTLARLTWERDHYKELYEGIRGPDPKWRSMDAFHIEATKRGYVVGPKGLYRHKAGQAPGIDTFSP